MVCKFKFSVKVILKKYLALYVPRFNSDGPLKFEVSHFKNLDLSCIDLACPDLVYIVLN